MIVWPLQANSLAGAGIPLIFKAAVILQLAGKLFHGTIKFQVQTEMGLRMSG
jgi:hypothetical protein